MVHENLKGIQEFLNEREEWNIESEDEVDLADGSYEGLQSGYTVTVENIKFRTSVGLKGLNIPVKITVLNKKAKVKTK